MTTKYRIRIVHDEHYEIDGATGWGEPMDSDYAAETREKFENGMWDVYGTIVEHECPACGSMHEAGSLWGSVDDTGADGTYEDVRDIPNLYLQSVASDLLAEHAPG